MTNSRTDVGVPTSHCPGNIELRNWRNTPERFRLSGYGRFANPASSRRSLRAEAGMIENPEQVAGLDVAVLVLSNPADGSGGDHSVASCSPAAIQALFDMSDAEIPTRDGCPELLRLDLN